MQRQHGEVALSVSPVAGWIEDIGAVRPQRAVAGPEIAVQQRGLGLVAAEALLHVLNDGIDIAEM